MHTLPRADIGSYLNLVLAKDNINLKKQVNNTGMRKLEMKKLNKQAMKYGFVKQYEENYLNLIGTAGSTNGKLDFIKHCLLDLAEEVIGYHEKRNKKE